MHLFEKLRKIGGKLGLLEVQAAAPNAPQKIVTRAVNLDELAAQVRADDVRTLAEQGEALPELAAVFQAAGVKPASHGWTMERVRKLVEDDARFRGLNGEALQKALLGHLMNVGANIEDLVRDAVSRDEALDAFEARAAEKLNARRLVRERRLTELDAQIAALQHERNLAGQEADAEDRRWKQWKDGKVAYEKELARLVGLFVDKPLITTE